MNHINPMRPKLFLILLCGLCACHHAGTGAQATAPSRHGAGPEAILQQTRRDTLEGRWDEAAARLRKRLARVAPQRLELRALLTAELGRVLLERNSFYQYDPQPAVATIEQAKRLAEQAGAKATLAKTLHLLGRYWYSEKLGGKGDWETPRGYFRESLRLYQELGDTQAQAESYFYIGLVHQWQPGEESQARENFQRADDLAQKLGDQVMQSFAARHLAYLAETTGDLDDAQRGYQRSLDLRRAANFPVGVPFALITLAEFLVEHRKRPEEARSLLDEAIRVGQATRNRRGVFSAELARARLLAQQGDRSRALADARQAAIDARSHGDPEAIEDANKLVTELQAPAAH